MRNKIKIKDIAEKCGLSNTLVSLVLNDKASLHGIRTETQEKVLFTARKMGYFDMQAENEEQDADNNLVAMLVPCLKDQFVSEIASHFNNLLSEAGMSFSVISRCQDSLRFDKVLSNLKKFFSGFIIYGELADERMIRKLKTSNFPFVVLERQDISQKLNIVNSDVHEGYKLLASHINKLGYSRISLVSSDDIINSSCEKIAKMILKENIPGLELNEIIFADKMMSPGIETEKLFEALRPPVRSELILIQSSDMVYPVMTLLNSKKIRIPGDVALISLDDGIGFDLFSTPVTSLRRKHSAIASKVSHILWTEMKNSGKGKFKRSVKICPELIIRKSCGTV